MNNYDVLNNVINDQDFLSIKIQFKAYGFVEFEPIPGTTQSRWSLTKLGENTMTKLRVIRKST